MKFIMRFIYCLSILVLLQACARSLVGDITGPAGATGPAGPQGPTVTSTTIPANSTEVDVNNLVNDENLYRAGLGQALLSSGLSCTLYHITGGDRIQSTIAGHNTLTGISQVASFLLTTIIDQADTNVNTYLNILPVALQPLYTNLYLLRCQGQVVVRETGYYGFELTSDDGSLLYVDGSLVVDNDNGHGAVLVTGQKYLRRGVHSFRLDFAQSGGGNQALILKVNGSFIDPIYYYH